MTTHASAKALLIDLNGTLYVGHTPTPRAVAALERLRAARVPFVLCSNNSRESETRLLSTLRDMGLRATSQELMTSLGACRALVENRGLTPYLILSPEALDEFKSIPTRPPAECDAVVIGLFPPAFGYENMNTAFRILKQEPLSLEADTAASTPAVSRNPSPSLSPSQSGRKPVLIAPHKAAYSQANATEKSPAGLNLGVGPYVAALEYASGVKAEVVGKPTRAFFELALGRLRELGEGFRDEDVAIVGDDVDNDLGGGARELGLQRILVRTGKYRLEAEEGTHPPDAVYDSFADYVDAILV